MLLQPVFPCIFNELLGYGRKKTRNICAVVIFMRQLLDPLFFGNSIRVIANGRTVFRGIVSQSKSRPVMLRIAISLGTASGGTRDVATDDPGCMT